MSIDSDKLKEIGEFDINYLGRKTFTLGSSKEMLSWKRARKVTPLNEKFRIWSNENCKFKLKRIKIRNSKIKRKPYPNLVNYSPDVLRAPHNTSQYLTQNFRKRLPEVETTEEFSHDGEDEICITGGTMKGKFNSNILLGLDESNFTLDLNEYSSGVTDEGKERDKMSIYSTEFSTHDIEDTLPSMSFETTFDYPLYEYS